MIQQTNKEPSDWSVDSGFKELNDLRHALDKSAIVAVTDRTGTIIHVNDKFCEISKYSRPELLGKNHRIINSGHHPKEFFIDMWRTISSGQTWVGEIRNRAKDGSYYWVYTTIVPFLDAAGKPHQYVAIRFEITQRKLVEQRLEASNRELQDFASIAAHDLQEPLRKIQSFGDRLKTKFKHILPPDGQDFLDRMLNASSRMQNLIEALLTYSRVTTKGMPFEPTDLNQVLQTVLNDLELRIDQTKAKIEKQPLPKVECDPIQMHQLFQNIISNGLKFVAPGSTPQIQISSDSDEHSFKLYFKDNGIGFDEKYLDRIFTIFQRLHGKMEYEGTGIGLSVCRRIVERHGGTITAKSTLSTGTTFIVSLPRVQKREE